MFQIELFLFCVSRAFDDAPDNSKEIDPGEAEDHFRNREPNLLIRTTYDVGVLARCEEGAFSSTKLGYFFLVWSSSVIKRL